MAPLCTDRQTRASLLRVGVRDTFAFPLLLLELRSHGHRVVGPGSLTPDMLNQHIADPGTVVRSCDAMREHAKDAADASPSQCLYEAWASNRHLCDMTQRCLGQELEQQDSYIANRLEQLSQEQRVTSAASHAIAVLFLKF